MKAFQAFYHYKNNRQIPLSKLALSFASLMSRNLSRSLSLILRRHIHVSFQSLGESKIDQDEIILGIESFKAPIFFYLGITKEVLPYITHYFFGGIERNYQKLSNPNSFSETFILENFGKIFTSSLLQTFNGLVGNDLGLNFTEQGPAEFSKAYQSGESFELFHFSFTDHGEEFHLSFYVPVSFFNKLSLV